MRTQDESKRPEWRVTPAGWIYSTRGIAVRLFLTCWLVYTLHFASNTVREIYLALAIGDHLSFRVDEYAHLHPDLFEKEGYGWHIGANPGASMLAAIPYALSRPIIDRVVERVNRMRSSDPSREPPQYDSPWPMAQKFYQEAWKRGLDIKFGLGAFVMQAFAMAPSSALGVVFVFYVLRLLVASDKIAFWLSLLYAFGTPVFFRSGYLNHNMMLGHFAFMGFVALWNPGGLTALSSRTRCLLGGIAGGLALLFDYSGVVLLLGLFGYVLWSNYNSENRRELIRNASWYVLGTLGPVFLLWWYQWRSFGNPFLPGQHWMPPVEWIERGYQGFSLPQPDLLVTLLFDYRFGLFTAAPLFLLAALAPIVLRRPGYRLPSRELQWILGLSLLFWLFLSGIHYTRLQFNTGIRYFAPIFPFLFIPAALVLLRLPKPPIYFAGVTLVAYSWCLAMYRDVERGLGLLEPLLNVFIGGFRLPALSVMSMMGDQFGEYVSRGVSPLPLFALAGAVICGLWWPALYRRKISQSTGLESGTGGR